MTCGSWRASPRTDSSAPRAQPPLTPSYVFLPPTLLLSHSVSPFRFLSHSASTTLFSARFYPPLVLLPRKTRRIGQPRSTTTCCFSSTILLRILDYSLSLFIPSSRRSLLFILPPPNANEDFCIFLLPHEGIRRFATTALVSSL